MLLDTLQLGSVALFYVIAAVFVAYTLKGVSGFGAGLMAIPLLAMVMPLAVCVPAVSLLSYGGNIAQSVALHRNTAWRELWPLAPFSLMGVGIAVWLLSNVDSRQLALALGVFVMLYSLNSLLPTPQWKGSRGWAAPIGCLGGLIGALFGSGGFIYVVYLKLRDLDKDRFRASVATTLFFDGTFRLGGYASAGLYSEQSLTLTAVGLPVMLIALFAGHCLQKHISTNRFYRLISVMLFICSVLLIGKSLA
ncbi:MAG: sulfite exporter TauE/SafE family protein [Pseudomonadota bacterium]